MTRKSLKAADYADLYDRFTAPVAKRHDCGRYCAPLNDGAPVCCTTEHAVPIVAAQEWRLLKSRTDLWRKFKPFDKATREIVDDLDSSCRAVECKGFRHCERDNRSLSCRTFPFFPYCTAEGKFVGLATYWTFEDRCWVMSNLLEVDKGFVREMVDVYRRIFKRAPDEQEPFMEESATMRRVFSRWKRPIYLLSLKGELLCIPPNSKGRIEPAPHDVPPPVGPYKSVDAYRGAVLAAGGGHVKKRDLPPGLKVKKSA